MSASVKSAPFLAYINRCQFLAQQGLFCADVCYYYGDHVPNFAQLKQSDPAKILPGYDYDVITEEALLTRMSVKDGRLMLPDGMNYRALVLPADCTIISLPVLRKLKELAAAGATIIGPRPTQASGLTDYPQSDAQVAKIAEEMWNRSSEESVKGAAYGKGRIIWGKTAREVLRDDGVKPDFEYTDDPPNANIDYIHRTAGNAEIYFISNCSNRVENLQCTFRVAEKAPEIWDAVSGQHHFAAAYTQAEGRTTVPLEFSPCGSCFVIFHQPAANHPATAGNNCLKLAVRGEISGPWTVKFDPKWGGPESAKFDQLESWTMRPEPSIKYYSGTAVYHKIFDLPAPLSTVRPGSRVFLDLGQLRELAEVHLNGKDLGVRWAPPFRVDITDAMKPAGNTLEVEVVNFWPNRIIGDQFLPQEQRRTRTNIRKLTQSTPLAESGLFGPVQVLEQD